eukprot:c14583_g1_i1 orf=2-163(-)
MPACIQDIGLSFVRKDLSIENGNNARPKQNVKNFTNLIYQHLLYILVMGLAKAN